MWEYQLADDDNMQMADEFLFMFEFILLNSIWSFSSGIFSLCEIIDLILNRIEEEHSNAQNNHNN